jgi:hypothetical protein
MPLSSSAYSGGLSHDLIREAREQRERDSIARVGFAPPGGPAVVSWGPPVDRNGVAVPSANQIADALIPRSDSPPAQIGAEHRRYATIVPPKIQELINEHRQLPRVLPNTLANGGEVMGANLIAARDSAPKPPATPTPLRFPEQPYRVGEVQPSAIDRDSEGFARDAQWADDNIAASEQREGAGSAVQAYRFMNGGAFAPSEGRGGDHPSLNDHPIKWHRLKTGLSSAEKADADRSIAESGPASDEAGRGVPVRPVAATEKEQPAPQRGALPAPPAVAAAKPNAEMPPIPARPEAVQMGPDADDGGPLVKAMNEIGPVLADRAENAARIAASKKEVDRRRSMADLRGIHPNTRVFFDKAVAGTEHDQNGDGRLSPDEWADMPALERGRMRREAHDQQRVHTQANYRDHVGTQNMARNEGLSYGHARARLQSGRAAEMIGQGNVLLSSPQAEDRMRGRALIAQGEAMKEHAESAVKMHEGLVAQNASAQNDAFFKSMMMGGANHRNPALGANVVAAAGGVLEQQAQNFQREADRDLARERMNQEAGNAAADRNQRGELAGKQLELAYAELDAKISNVDKEIAAHERAGNLKEKIEAEHRKQDLEFKRANLLNDNAALALNQKNAADRRAEAAEPGQLHDKLRTMTQPGPIQQGGPSLQEQEQDYLATLNRIQHLPENVRTAYTDNWNRFVRSHIAGRMVGAAMRQSDFQQLNQMISQVHQSTGQMVTMPVDAFVESVAQHYSGPHQEELRKRLAAYHAHYLNEQKKVAPPPGQQTSVGTDEAAAFTA